MGGEPGRLGYALWNVALHRSAGWWAASYAATALALAPWAIYVWERAVFISRTTERFRPGGWASAARVLSVFSLGVTWHFSESLADLSPQLIPFVLLLIVGGVSVWRPRTAFLLVWLGLPIAGAAKLGFTGHRDWTRFFIAASPAFYLLLAQGALDLGGLARRVVPGERKAAAGWVVTAAALVPIFVLPLPSLRNYYVDPAYARPDYRGVAERIAKIPGHAVVQDGSNRSLAFSYYYADHASYFVVPSACEEASESGMAEQLRQAVAGRREIWLLRSNPVECDPHAFIPFWLSANAYPAEEFWIENVVFTRFLNPPALSEGGTQAGRVGDSIELQAWGADRARVAPGEALSVSLTWTSPSALARDYHVFVFLADATEEVAALRDAVPVMWLRPTTTWQPGERVIDHHGLVVKPDARPGDYWLGVGLYDAETGERLPVTSGEGWLDNTALRLMRVRVAGP